MRRPVVVGVALGLVAVVVAWWLLFFSPKGDELNDTKDEVATAERTEQQLRADLARLQELDAERPAQEAKLAQFAALVPPPPTSPASSCRPTRSRRRRGSTGCR
ncbi:MAG: hypothetical protein M5U14_06815 [Acidimicrobiia bacterium]|nr:hypothetical protein [Acidimicrobiia bacterium]